MSGKITLELEYIDIRVQNVRLEGNDHQSSSESKETDSRILPNWISEHVIENGLQCSVQISSDSPELKWQTSKTDSTPIESCSSKKWRNVHPAQVNDQVHCFKSSRTWLETESCEISLNEKNMASLLNSEVKLDVRLGATWKESSIGLGETKLPLETILKGFPFTQKASLTILGPTQVDEAEESPERCEITANVRVRCTASPSIAYFVSSGVQLALRDCVIEEPPQRWIEHLVNVCDYREQLRQAISGEAPPIEDEKQPSINIHPASVDEAQDLQRIAEKCADWTVHCKLRLPQVEDSPELVVDGLKLRFHFFEATEVVDVSDDESESSAESECKADSEEKSTTSQEGDDQSDFPTTRTVLRTWWSVGSSTDQAEETSIFLCKKSKHQLIAGIKEGRKCVVTLEASRIDEAIPEEKAFELAATSSESKRNLEIETPTFDPPTPPEWSSSVEVSLNPLLNEAEDCMNARCDLLVSSSGNSGFGQRDGCVDLLPRVSVVISSSPCLNPDDGLMESLYNEQKLQHEDKKLSSMNVVEKRYNSDPIHSRRGLEDLDEEIKRLVDTVKAQLKEMRCMDRSATTPSLGEAKASELHALPSSSSRDLTLALSDLPQADPSVCNGVLGSMSTMDKSIFHRVRFAVVRLLREEYRVDAEQKNEVDPPSHEFIQSMVAEVYHRILGIVQKNTYGAFQTDFLPVSSQTTSGTLLPVASSFHQDETGNIESSPDFPCANQEAKMPEDALGTDFPEPVRPGTSDSRSLSRQSSASSNRSGSKEQTRPKLAIRKKKSPEKQQECARLKQQAKDAELVGEISQAQTAWQNLLVETSFDSLDSGCTWIEYGCFLARQKRPLEARKSFLEGLDELDRSSIHTEGSLADFELATASRCTALLGVALIRLDDAEKDPGPALEILSQGLELVGAPGERIFKAGIVLACDMSDAPLPRLGSFGEDPTAAIGPLQELAKTALDLCRTSVAQGAVALAIRLRRGAISVPSAKPSSASQAHRLSGGRRSRTRPGPAPSDDDRAASAPEEARARLAESAGEFDLHTALLRARAKFIEGKARACVDILEAAYSAAQSGSGANSLSESLWLLADVCFTLADGYILLASSEKRGQSRKWLAMALSAIRDAQEQQMPAHPLSRGHELYHKVAYKFGAQATLDGEVRAARAVFLNATRNPDTRRSSWSWTGLGATCLRTGELKYSMAALEKALTYDVDSPVTWAYLSIAVLKLRGRESAARALQHALDLGLCTDGVLGELETAFTGKPQRGARESTGRLEPACPEQVRLIQARRQALAKR